MTIRQTHIPADLRLLIPDVKSIDFNNTDEINGCGHLLLSLLQRAPGYCCGTKPLIAAAPVLTAAKEWIEGVEEAVKTLPGEDAIPALVYYDLLHRMAWRRPVSDTFINEIYLRAFDARIRGNYSISEAQLYNAISQRIMMRDRLFFGKPLQWNSLIMGKWHKALSRKGKFDDATPAEALDRVSIIISQDMMAFCGNRQDSFKQSIVNTYLPSLDSLDSMDAKALCSLNGLIGTARSRYIDWDKSEAYRADILSRLAAYPGLNPHHRRAYRLDLAFATTLTTSQ